jgi:hypothetical protein
MKYGCEYYVFLFVGFIVMIFIVNSCFNCNDTASSNYVHGDEDTAYWNSVQKEKELRDVGYDGAANMEENARHDYNHGGGYHSKDGSRQVDYKGSKEQQRDLEMMKEQGY